MAENEKKVETPPKVEENVQPVKSAEELQKELKIVNEKNEALSKEKETSAQGEKHWKEVAGRQSGELGELRKEKTVSTEASDKTVDADILELAKSLEKDEKLLPEDALYNAKLLIKTNQKLNAKRMMNDVSDMIEDALDEKKIDGKIYKENEDAIFEEFRGRKVAPTARKNFKIFRECIDIVTKRKAEELRTISEAEGEKKRTDAIDAGAQAPGGGAPITDTEADKVAKGIKDAGTNRESVFF